MVGIYLSMKWMQRSSGFESSQNLIIENWRQCRSVTETPSVLNYQNHIKINIDIVIEVLGSIGRGKIFIIKYIIEKDLELKCLQINRKMASKEFRNRNDVSRNFCFKNGLNNFGISSKILINFGTSRLLELKRLSN